MVGTFGMPGKLALVVVLKLVYLFRDVNNSPASLSDFPPAGHRVNITSEDSLWFRNSHWLMLLAAAGVPLSLLWDFSWESTVGIDLVEAPPHVATYLAIAVAGLTALAFVLMASWSSIGNTCTVRVGVMRAPLGIWVAGWGAVAYLTAFLFDRWWQSQYGLSAGIWHPPQILKTVAFFSVVMGAWLFGLMRQNQSTNERESHGAAAFVIEGGLVLALISVVTLMSIYPNRQHSASFYRIACGTYPLVLVAVTLAGKSRWPATVAALTYTLLFCVMVWLLPLFPAKPQVPPIYNPLEHLMPPPFPLLLVVPAIALDLLCRNKLPFALPVKRWKQAIAAGLTFFIAFISTQWIFAEFLLSDLADNWFFAGGGRHWPFFLKIDSLSRTQFWKTADDEMNLANTAIVAALAVAAAYLGLWIGAWMKAVRR